MLMQIPMISLLLYDCLNQSYVKHKMIGPSHISRI